MASQRELDVVGSLVVAQLPFPPMPLVVRRGDGTEDFCSSHDLLASAVKVYYATGCAQSVDNEEEVRRMHAKTAILLDLQRRVHDCVEAGEDVQAAYEVYQDCFRQYMLLYQTSADLRFLPLGAVDPAHTITQQAAEHMRGLAEMEQCAVAAASDRYPDVVAAYARHLHAYGRDEHGVGTGAMK